MAGASTRPEVDLLDPHFHVGEDATLLIAGIATVDGGGIAELHAVTTRMTVRSQFTGLPPV